MLETVHCTGQIPMRKVISRPIRGGLVHCLLSVAVVVGWATWASGQPARAPMPGPRDERETRRTVQAIRLEPSVADGQTSWIIEPDVPRIPKVAGLEGSLPPHIERRMAYAFDLAQRGAPYSAQSEFRAVLALCALELDAREGGTSRRQALYEGWTALEEADDFATDASNWRSALDARQIAASHVTPVLKREDQPMIDPIQAAQNYYIYAEERLSYACGGLRGASLAFYGLGRTYVVPGVHMTHAAGKAALLQRVALRVAPQNALAGNELGVLLAQHGRLDEAEQIFQQCVATDATPETLRNLAAVYARKGDETASRTAMAASDALAAKRRESQPVTADPVVEKQDGAVANGAVPDNSQPQEPPQKTGLFSKLDLASKLPAWLRR